MELMQEMSPCCNSSDLEKMLKMELKPPTFFLTPFLDLFLTLWTSKQWSFHIKDFGYFKNHQKHEKPHMG
jgi:hypothetical protein